MKWRSSTRDRDADPNGTGRSARTGTGIDSHYEGHQAESEYGGQFVNVTFGGPERNRLFVTATSSLYRIYLDREGAQRL
jgi:hypothetical protein